MKNKNNNSRVLYVLSVKRSAKFWYSAGRMNTEDIECVWASKGNRHQTPQIILAAVKIRMVKIADTLKLSKEGVGYIVAKYFSIRELSAGYVPRELTFDHSTVSQTMTKFSSGS